MGYFGCHLSASGGNCAMIDTALSIGANTFAFFTRNPRGSRAKAEGPADAARAVVRLREENFGNHACVSPSGSALPGSSCFQIKSFHFNPKGTA